jgi:RNA polymerase sigma-70 factor, ECF subfamily
MAEATHVEQFVQQLTLQQRRLYGYILTLMGGSSDADEVLQETNLTLWRKSAEFQPGTNFGAWAFRTAYFEVLAFRKRTARDRLSFEPEVIERLADESLSIMEQFESRREALSACLAKLRERDRELLLLRYRADTPVEAIAEQVGRSVQAVYQALYRIRGSLSLCMRRAMAREG